MNPLISSIGGGIISNLSGTLPGLITGHSFDESFMTSMKSKFSFMNLINKASEFCNRLTDFVGDATEFIDGKYAEFKNQICDMLRGDELLRPISSLVEETFRTMEGGGTITVDQLFNQLLKKMQDIEDETSDTLPPSNALTEDESDDIIEQQEDAS